MGSESSTYQLSQSKRSQSQRSRSSTFTNSSASTVPDLRAARRRDLTFAKRKLYFDASQAQSVNVLGTEHRNKPQYSVSYKNWPYVAYDVIEPSKPDQFY